MAVSRATTFKSNELLNDAVFQIKIPVVRAGVHSCSPVAPHSNALFDVGANWVGRGLRSDRWGLPKFLPRRSKKRKSGT